MAPTTKKAVLLGDTSIHNHHGCQRVIENLYAGLAKQRIEVINTGCGDDWIRRRRLREDIRRSDLLIINGEGSIHHDRKVAHRLVEAGTFAAEHHVSAVLINTTWHENSRALAEQARIFRQIFVRESLSQQELDQHGVEARVVPDLTFYSGAHPNGQPRRLAAVTDSAKKEVGRSLYALAAGSANLRYLPILSPFRLRNWSRKSCLLWAKHQFYRWSGGVLQRANLVPLRYKSLHHALPSADEYLDCLAHCSTLVAGRFHAVCFALQTTTPFFAVKSNSHKIEGLYLDAGISRDRLVELDDLGEKLFQQPQALQFSPGEQARITRYVNEAPNRIDAMFEQIASLC